MSDVLIIKTNERGIRKTVNELLEHFPLKVKDKRILIKPNILGPFPPERGVTTSPEVVRAVLDAVIDMGAREVWVGDNPGIGGYGANLKAGVISGITNATGKYFTNIGEEVVRIPVRSRYVKSVVFSKYVVDADIIINLPRFKTHNLTQLTGAIKNTFGYIAGGMKSWLHTRGRTSREFSELIVDIYARRVPDLTIVDGLTAMEGRGPSNGRLRHLGILMASYDGVACDYTISRMMGTKPNSIFQIKYASKTGLFSPENVRIKGDYTELEDFEMPTISSPIISYIANHLVFPHIYPKPVVNEERCINCGNCQAICPTNAMEQFPHINYDRCIKCYCCQETCPQDAVELKGFIYEILKRR